MSDIFEFWSRIDRGEHVHPADAEVLKRMEPERHGFELGCLPAAFAGRLRTAPVVLLFLSPGFDKEEPEQAKLDQVKDYYVKRWSGDEPLRADDPKPTRTWIESRVRPFGAYDAIASNISLLNIGCYHSRDVSSFGSLLALPSSRVSLDWAQAHLFPEAEAGKRIVICMRSAVYWGLEVGRRYGHGLFAPHVTRRGDLIKNDDYAALIKLVRSRVGTGAPVQSNPGDDAPAALAEGD